MTANGVQNPFEAASRDGTKVAANNSHNVLASDSFLQRQWSNKPDNILETRRESVKRRDCTKVREALTAEENARASEAMVNQFLRATNHNVPQSVKRLKDTLKWRAAEEPERMVCRACLAKPRAHYMHPCGFDNLDRPVIYSCFAAAHDRNILNNRNHMIAGFEQCIRAMPQHVEQWVWVSDFQGFGLSDCDPRLAKIFLDISAWHYPERLGLFLVVGAPSVFNMLWRAIAPMVDASTKRKIRFLPFDAHPKHKKKSALEAELAAHFDEDMAAWLLKEMMQNRSRKLVKKKVYPYGKLHCCDDESCVLEGHDSRGTPDLIATIKRNPGVMMPANPLPK